MEIYLDNSATTKPYKEVIDKMVYALDTDYANPSSLHRKGVEVEVEKFCEDSMHMVVRINGKNKYNFYGPTFADLFSLVEMRNSMLCSDLDRVNL